MKIIITGSNGFIGKNLVEKLKGFQIVEAPREKVNLLNYNQVQDFFNKEQPDKIIHCASVGGRRNDIDNEYVFEQNVMMSKNLLTTNIPIIYLNTGSIKNTYYSLSKHFINKLMLENGNYSISIYGCFGKYEEPQRYIRSIIDKVMKNETIVINKNIKMSFVYVDDLVKLISKILLGKVTSKTIIATYKEAYTLKQIAEIMFSILGKKSPIVELLHDNLNDYYFYGDLSEDNYDGMVGGLKNYIREEIY